MKDKKILIICVSIHHGNTMKVAKIISKNLNARVVTPGDVNTETLSAYDLIGLGSGIYNHKHHGSLFALIEKFKFQDNQKVFIFSTNTFGLKILHKLFKDSLIEKGYDVVGEFSCPGYINYSFLKYFFVSLNKNRPNENDLQKARNFSQKIII
ncbi:MAG TPA: flavodoxin domain-containing protein [Patescibacteria group bacterium]|nr:flavodoxin domain-containing protein [Patescibacteria group bacterium]